MKSQHSMSSYIAPHVQAIAPSGIRKFFDLVSQSKDVISLGVGEPDFSTPWHVRDACISSLERGQTQYTSNAGLLELREAIARYLEVQYGISYRPQTEMLVTIGGSEAIDIALRALLSPLDEVLIPQPSYVSYSPIVLLAGAAPVAVHTSAANHFKLTVSDLEEVVTSRTKVLILNYPNNPTGAIMTYEDWLPIIDFVKKHDLIVISDEIYSELTYGVKHVSFAGLPGMRDHTLLINGFSKAFAMTGWRLGYLCGHSDLIEAMLKIHQYTVMCAPIMAQYAGLEALSPNGIEEKNYMVQSYNERRRMMIEGLKRIGLSCHTPQGAFYAFPSIQSTSYTSEEFAKALLEEVNVAVVPGTAFGECGEGHIRCSYATSTPQILEALARMERFLQKVLSKN